jgi:hypothetical protein
MTSLPNKTEDQGCHIALMQIDVASMISQNNNQLYQEYLYMNCIIFILK